MDEPDTECISCGKQLPHTMMPFAGRILDCPYCHSGAVLHMPPRSEAAQIDDEERRADLDEALMKEGGL